MKNKGFTLIELLVVVAIIGILATVVLASLGSARQRARNAALQSAMAQLRTQMEIYYNDNSTYVGGCASTEIDSIETTITANKGADAIICNETAAGFAYQADFASAVGTAVGFCVDSTGYAGAVVAADVTALGTATDVTCEA